MKNELSLETLCSKFDVNCIEFNQVPSNVQMISTISHEFRTPLSVINSNLQLLREYEGSLDSSTKEESYDMCQHAVEAMSKILENIYLLNSSNKGYVKPNIKPFQLDDLIRSIIKEFKHETYIKRIKLDYQIDDSCIVSDKGLIRQIIINLLSNALKYSQHDVNLIIKQNIKGRCLNISVSDSGIGIPANEIKQIFEPFYRATNIRMINGSGLGLSVVISCIKNLKGSMEIRTEENRGTNFKIVLPYEKEEACFNC